MKLLSSYVSNGLSPILGAAPSSKVLIQKVNYASNILLLSKPTFLSLCGAPLELPGSLLSSISRGRCPSLRVLALSLPAQQLFQPGHTGVLLVLRGWHLHTVAPSLQLPSRVVRGVGPDSAVPVDSHAGVGGLETYPSPSGISYSRLIPYASARSLQCSHDRRIAGGY